MQWALVGHYLFDSSILAGIRTTMVITAASMAIGLILAVVVVLMRLSSNWVLRSAAFIWVLLLRGVPPLVLLIVWYNIALFFPSLGLGVPLGHQFFHLDTHNLVSPLGAAIVSFSLSESAFASEVLRAAILAVPKGQQDAARALGMKRGRVFRRIVFPQAFRIAIPSLANETIYMVKSTSLVAFIGVFDLMGTAQAIYQSNFEVVPLLIVVSIWYVVIVSVLSGLQYLLERWSGRQGIWRTRRWHGSDRTSVEMTASGEAGL
jgi:polar amino acid transport system permease protein